MRQSFTYTNPITSGRDLSLRDHFIIRAGDGWYMTGTSNPVWTGPNPGVKLFYSSDLLHWEFDRWLIEAAQLPDDCFYKGRFWAPEIHHAHDSYWLTVNSGHYGPELGDRLMDEHNIVLFVAETITGPYELVTKERPLGTGFKNDASLFTDDDGSSYIYCSGGGLWQAQIDLRRGALLEGDFTKILAPGDAANPDWMIGGIEGPFVIKRDGSYFMFFSAWTRGYEIGVLRAPTPLGPWKLTSPEPIFGSRKRHYREKQMREGGYAHLVFDDTPDPFVETGHCAIFEGPDRKDWLCCHYFVEGSEPVLGSIIPEWHDTAPQLGLEPVRYANGQFTIDGPTWTKQTVSW